MKMFSVSVNTECLMHIISSKEVVIKDVVHASWGY